MRLIFSILFCVIIVTCAKSHAKNDDTPSWYVSPKQNNSSYLYGVAEGFTLEEATKSALADAAARLIVNISSETTLLREEDKNNANEETRQQIKQNIEKIEFTNFTVSNSKKIDSRFFVEISLPRDQFILAQKEKFSFLNKQISDLKKNLATQNLVQKRASLASILDLSKQGEIIARILVANNDGNNKEKDLRAILDNISQAKNELNKMNNNVEFFIDADSSRDVYAILRSAFNKEKIKVTNNRTNSKNQIALSFHLQKNGGEVYGAYITKVKIDFEGRAENKIIASNVIEVSGSSSLGEKESYLSALESLREKIDRDGILKVIGILN